MKMHGYYGGHSVKADCKRRNEQTEGAVYCSKDVIIKGFISQNLRCTVKTLLFKAKLSNATGSSEDFVLLNMLYIV